MAVLLWMNLRAANVDLPFNSSVLGPIDSALDSIQAVTDPNEKVCSRCAATSLRVIIFRVLKACTTTLTWVKCSFRVIRVIGTLYL